MVKIKNWYLKFLAITLTGLFLLGNTSLFAQVSVGFDPNPSYGQPSTSGKISVVVGNLPANPSIYSYGFEVNFDPTYISIDGYDKTGTRTDAAGGTVIDNKTTPGKYVLQYAGFPGKIQDGSGNTLIKLNVTYKVPTLGTVLTLGNVIFNGDGALTGALSTGTIIIPTTTIKFPDYTSGVNGVPVFGLTDVISVPVTVNKSLSDLGIVAYSFTISFNPADISVESYDKVGTASANGQVISNINNAAGTGTITFSQSSQISWVPNTDILPLLKFNVKIKSKGTKTTALTLGPVYLQKSDASYISNTNQNGSLTWSNRLPVFPALPTPLNKNEGELVTFDVSTNVTDADGEKPTIEYTFTQNPADPIQIPQSALNTATGVFSWTPNFDQHGTYNLVFKADDKNGGTQPTQPVVINIAQVNRKPSGLVIQDKNPASLIVDQGNVVTFKAVGDDPDLHEAGITESLTYTITADPANPKPVVFTNTVFNPTTGVFTWTPEFGLTAVGTYKFYVNVKDLALATMDVPVTVTIVVNYVNGAPVWSSPAVYMGDQTIREGVKNLSFTYAAYDKEGDPLTYILAVNKGGVLVTPSWLYLDPINKGKLIMTPQVNDRGSYTVSVGVSDNVAGHNTVWSPNAVITVVADNKPWVELSTTSISNAIVGTAIPEITVLSKDADGVNGDMTSLSYTVEPAGTVVGVVVDNNPLQGAKLNFTPTAPGTYKVTFTAKDLSDLVSDPVSVTIKVYAPKVITLGPVVTGNIGDIIEIPVGCSSELTASDAVSVMSFDLNYNPNIFQIQPDFIKGVLASNPDGSMIFNPNSSVGKATFTYSGINPIIAANGGNIIKIKAKLLKITTPTDLGTLSVSAAQFNAGFPPVTLPAGVQITVNARKPILAAIPDITGKKEEEVITFTATATDPDLSGITYSTDAATIITGVSETAPVINPTTGVFTWKPGWYQKGTWTFTVTATNGSGLTDVKTVRIIVDDNNRAPYNLTVLPVAPSDGYYLVGIASTLSLTANAKDDDTDNQLTYSLASPGLENASIDPVSGVFTFKPSTAQTLTYTVTIVATDNSTAMASTSKTIQIKVDVKAPSFSVTGAWQLPQFGTRIREGQVKKYTYIAIDPQGLPLRYELSQPSPKFASISNEPGHLGELTLAPQIGDGSPASYPVYVVASNNVVSTGSNISYVKVDPDTKPVVQAVSSQLVGNKITVNELTQIDFVVNTIDPDLDEVVVLTSNPVDPSVTMPGASFVVNSTPLLQTGTFSWKPALGKAGIYTITFKGKDLSSVDSDPLVITIEVKKNNFAPVITSKLADKSVAAGSTVTFKYEATDDNGDPLTWAVVSPAGAQIDQSGNFSYVANTPGSIAVDVTVTDGFSTPVHATATLTVSGFTINGKVTYYTATGKALANVNVVLTKQDNTTVTKTTDATGTYMFDNLAPSLYQISFAKNDEWGGVNAADALAIARNVVFRDDPAYPNDQFNVVRTKAADVTGDGQVTSDDALAVLYRFVGRIPNGWTGPDWVFDSPATVTVQSANVTNNVVALAKGDANLSLFNTVAKSNATFGGSVVKINAKASFDIPVTANMINDLGSISMKMSYPAELAKFNGITFNSKLNNVVYKNNASEGTISVAWISDVKTALNLGNKEVLFTLKFTATDKFQRGNSFALTLDPLSEITSNNGTMLEKSSLNAPKVEVSVPDAFSLKQNYPNPFNPSTTIAYDIPVSGRVKLVVMNILGQQVATVLDAVQDAGSYKVNFDASRLSSGVYIYTMTVEGASQKYTKTNRMVLMK